MRRFSSILLFTTVFLSAGPSYSQSPAGSSFPNQSTEPESTLQVNSRLVVVDVVVRKGDRPVSGLQQSDFELYEDGVRQTIRYFTPHFADEAATASAAAADEQLSLPPGTWSDLPIAHVTDSVTVLLLDGLNTAIPDVQNVRREVISYLKTQPPDRRIAVFALGHRLQMLQGFTTDASQLMAALKRASATAPASLLLPEDQKTGEANILGAMEAERMSPQTIANTNNFMGEADATQEAMRVQITLEAMQQLSRYLAGVPGRKNLVWLSGSFPLQQLFSFVVLPNGQKNLLPIQEFNQETRKTADMLTAARVAVYPVDARGVVLQPMFQASTSYSPGSGGPQGGSFGTDQQLAPIQRAADHSAMDDLAQQTGGRAVYESNGLQKAIADALSDGSNFYTLSYVPTNANYNGALRKIEIRLVQGKKDKLFYRRSYYADADVPAKKAVAQDSHGIFLASMQHGIPASSQIIFDVRLEASHGEPPSGPIAGENSAMKNRAARYEINYTANIGTIDLIQNVNGVRQGHVDVLAIAYDRDGKPLNWTSNEVTIALDQEAWSKYSHYGLQSHQVLDLPAGEVYLRVGLYDPDSGHIGSLEIPVNVAAAK